MATRASMGIPPAIRVIDVESAPMLGRAHVRAGGFSSRRLLDGQQGTPGNFSLQLSLTPDTYFSPRHRHNFDQVRYQIEGEFDFASDGVMKPGSLAYFPEGTYYGPQSSSSRSLTLVLQFGGASGNGYMSAEQYDRAAAELRERGTFASGAYTMVTPDGRRINKDAYEAVWEHLNGRPLVYSPERYWRPVFMEPQNFSWMPIKGQPGASGKCLGEFSERRSQLWLYRVEPSATFHLEGHSIYFVASGTGSAAAQDFRPHATIYVPDQTPAILSSRDTVELLRIGLPIFL
ncbi:MAG: cupin domain-containing protein [Candidatus Acidiferrales bacterium]